MRLTLVKRLKYWSNVMPNLLIVVQWLFASPCAQWTFFAHGSCEFRPFASNLIYSESNTRFLPKRSEQLQTHAFCRLF